MMYFLLLVGFVLLIKGADFFVEGSSSIARMLKIPSLIIGLTIVAMGTSAPETAVSITASLTGNNDIAVGNIIGSNIFNLLIVIGVSVLIFPVKSSKNEMKRDTWWNIGVSVLLLLLILDGELSRVDGVILLIGMTTYLILIILKALKFRSIDQKENIHNLKNNVKNILYMTIGLIAIVLGGNFVVEEATKIATVLGMSNTLIGLTIVAVGTSLPELATSIAASRKGDTGIALGNAVGSCLFNIMFILGFSAVLSPLVITKELIIDSMILILVTFIILFFSNSRQQFNRREGLLSVLLYLGYSIYIIMR